MVRPNLTESPPSLPPGLRDLLRLRYSAPVLAELYRRDGARVVELASVLAVSRITIRQTLDHVIACHWAAPNPGHGHPLRPEYILTDAGRELAARCSVLGRLAAREGVLEAIQRRWSIPIILALGDGAERFSEVRRALHPMTDRALALALRVLDQAGIVLRDPGGGGPQDVRYALSPAAGVLRPACKRLRAYFEPAE